MDLFNWIKRDERWFWVLLAVLAAAGCALIWFITPYGMGLVNDSIAYVGGARNIVAGEGYSRITGSGMTAPITNYPPMLSIVLAFLGLIGIEILTLVRWLNVLLFGGNILLAGCVSRQVSSSNKFGLLAAVFFGISEPIFRAHTFAMTEPLYLFTTMVVLLLLLTYLNNQGWGKLLLAGAFSSAAFLTRYVGVSLYITVVLVIVAAKKDWGSRARAVMVYLAAGIPPVLAWLVRNIIVADNPVNRMLAWHPVPKKQWLEGIQNFWEWLMPERGGLVERFLPLWGFLLGLLIVFILGWVVTVYLTRMQANAEPGSWKMMPAWTIGVLALVYLGVLVFSLTFVDASPIFEHRILSPFYVCLIILLVYVLSRVWNRQLAGRIFVVVFSLVLLLSFMEDSIDGVRDLHKEGQGFASSSWRESQTILALGNIDDVQIYSNKPTAIYILNNQPAYYLPSPINPATQLPRENYEADLDAIRKQVLDGRAIMVLFDYRELQQIAEERPWMDDLTDGLPIYRELTDGVIFGLTQAAN